MLNSDYHTKVQTWLDAGLLTADVVLAKCKRTGGEQLVRGTTLLETLVSADVASKAVFLRVPIDFESGELELLAAACHVFNMTGWPTRL